VKAVISWPEKLDHEILLSFVCFTALTSHARSVLSKSIFTPSGREREDLNILFMNDTYILYDDRDKTGTKPPDAGVMSGWQDFLDTL
jgi:hypothetical protein